MARLPEAGRRYGRVLVQVFLISTALKKRKRTEVRFPDQLSISLFDYSCCETLNTVEILEQVNTVVEL
jgi:hypothetical protein